MLGLLGHGVGGVRDLEGQAERARGVALNHLERRAERHAVDGLAGDRGELQSGDELGERGRQAAGDDALDERRARRVLSWDVGTRHYWPI